jgi:NAD(P)-dependent dehydrogenase (short-subunit alcohol dehydrogenase family)
MAIEERVAVITGATGELGKAVARDLSRRGARLALLDRNAAKLAGLDKELALPESRIVLQAVDLLDEAATRLAAESVSARFGRIDILLHLVGGWIGGQQLTEAPAEALKLMLDQHVWTSFNAAKAFVPRLLANGWGRVIMITTPYAARPAAKGGPYAIGKAGQEALMLALSQELKGTGVTANLLQVKTIDAKRRKAAAPSAETSTWTTPEEIAAMVAFLISDPAATVNGARIPMFSSFG